MLRYKVLVKATVAEYNYYLIQINENSLKIKISNVLNIYI